MSSAQSLRECECAGRRQISANLDPYGDWIEIRSDAQVLVLNCCQLHILAAKNRRSF
jgi:hypothetical protein